MFIIFQKDQKSKQLVVPRYRKKIIPPIDFKFNTLSIQNALETTMIPRPLEQQVTIGRGFYDLNLIQKKSILLKDYQKLVEKDSNLAKNKPLIKIEENVLLLVLGKLNKTKKNLRS